MCAISEAKIMGVDVDVYMGYHGGELRVGSQMYKVNPEDVDNCVSESEMVSCLSQYGARNLAMLIVDLVKHSEEG